ncbi:sigma-70 family RNA polymerase sigma factor [Lutibacter sp. A64]|uniref:RNA polymerase sigma factor n=1 Tax=Lutibacter sp. A64 TaxID=2918526 RepID=UPI001F062030|nr:sigma-70 family RNA polymerase sigma factor [Lutibacter sp. A64]UMB52427.1 sigma-70 family RNA polymerase sigma factor [Lutibacter sp. A64]
MANKEKISSLVCSLKKGDQLAFKAIHNLYYKNLYAYINSFTKNDCETEDILQETFIKIWHFREKLNELDSIKSYIFKTAYYTYIDKYRKDKREQNVLDSWIYQQLIESIDEDDEINLMRIKKLRQEIDKLPKRCKEVFILCKFENLTHSQIANHLEISPKTVQAQMCKAYTLIRESFKDNVFLNLFLNFYKILKI